MAASSALIRLRPGLEKKIPVGERPDHALGRSRGGFSTKFHLVCEGQGLPLSLEVGPGQEHETQHVISLVEHLPAIRDAGDAACRPAKFAGDKGYSAGWVRQFLQERGIVPVIAHRKNETRPAEFDAEAYRQRNLIERCVGRLKECRRIATRYEKLGLHYLGMLHLGMILLWLRT
jgi:transposase